MNFGIDKTIWALLQIQLPDRRYEKQVNLFLSQIDRDTLLRKAFSLIPEKVKISRGSATWGLADLLKINDDLFSVYLTIRPPDARIAEELKPGHLQDTKDPRFYTLCVINIPHQIIMVHRASDISRYARSVNTFADIFEALLKDAIRLLNMEEYYLIEVDPIAKTGSFIEWFNNLDSLKKIIIRYTGPNLPSGASNLIESIRESARKYKNALKSRDVELVANEPDLNSEEVHELDQAIADRRLKLKAKGTKSGIDTTWNSSKKPIPETAIMPIDQEQLKNEKSVAERLNVYINNRLEER
ncbi:MAG: hypothetical protein PHU71_07435 [Candidatus Gracilibacteria bacterium]|nr:hypothetical protein [Candidatus Gracilibacteria bacterium]